MATLNCDGEPAMTDVGTSPAGSGLGPNTVDRGTLGRALHHIIVTAFLCIKVHRGGGEHMHTHTHTHKNKHTHARARADTHTQTHTHTYTQTHTHTHTHTHTQTHTHKHNHIVTNF